MTATLPSLTLSKDLLREIDEAAAETSLSREDLIRASVRTFLDQERRWKEIQDEVSERARARGIEREEDLEAFLDSIEEKADRRARRPCLGIGIRVPENDTGSGRQTRENSRDPLGDFGAIDRSGRACAARARDVARKGRRRRDKHETDVMGGAAGCAFGGRTRQESDNRILECAVAGAVDAIVTGDRRRLLPLRHYAGIPIMSPSAFLESWRQDPS
ncbi:MAG TPA: ribbon-helix-helix protein, CopG family [Thermomicrobiales bacterium]|jgi:hypothetical protein